LVVVARALDATGNKRIGISDPLEFCPFLGWSEDAVNVIIVADIKPVTTLTPTGLIALVGLLTVVVVSRIRKKQK
jgi:hypothetical protein